MVTSAAAAETVELKSQDEPMVLDSRVSTAHRYSLKEGRSEATRGEYRYDFDDEEASGHDHILNSTPGYSEANNGPSTGNHHQTVEKEENIQLAIVCVTTVTFCSLVFIFASGQKAVQTGSQSHGVQHMMIIQTVIAILAIVLVTVHCLKTISEFVK